MIYTDDELQSPTYVSDCDVWAQCPIEYLWIYDKLILARKCGYVAGPAGVAVPHAGWYIVRPITNIRMMSKGASKQWLTPADTDLVPDGYFWCECFTGRHTSVDFYHGKQLLAVEGFRDDPTRLDRFYRWNRINDIYKFPTVLQGLGELVPWVNVEYVDGNIIEVHLRWNDDFSNHTGNTIYPVWRDALTHDFPPSATWYDSPCGDRLGFWVTN